jgi:hypothetical protein
MSNKQITSCGRSSVDIAALLVSRFPFLDMGINESHLKSSESPVKAKRGTSGDLRATLAMRSGAPKKESRFLGYY